MEPNTEPHTSTTSRLRVTLLCVVLFSFLVIVPVAFLSGGNPNAAERKAGIFQAAPSSIANSARLAGADQEREPTGIITGTSYKNDVSPALRQMKQLPTGNKPEHETNPNPKLPHDHADLPDSVVQTFLAPDVMPTTILNFDGIPYPGVACNCAPPDTDGEVGLTQYVQIVNEGYQVFNKSTGASVLGPSGIATIWQGFGGTCESGGDGDPIVLYDQIANRWLISQFADAGNGTPTDECIAISTTSDATGSYNRYGFHLGSNYFDYPKIGVWPDGYYMSDIVFNAAGTALLGVQPFVFDRSAMLAGTSATFITPGLVGAVPTAENSFLPADLDGSTLPAAGTPCPFVEYPGNGAAGTYKTWLFHADFVTPANSTFTPRTSPAAAGFTVLCPTTRACVPQPAGTNLDGIGDRLMHRLAYRIIGGVERVVGNFTVSSGGVAGIRWFELRNVTSGSETVFQESTYQPDTTWRWMGSAAQDQSGNMALGFSASSTTLFPSIRYAGRLIGDPIGILAQGEATMFAGLGSQSATGSRWGDYSAMSIDPVDDCTFWYTQEYYPTGTTQFNWRTRIGNFKFASCSGAAQPAILSGGATLASESCAPTNGALDPNETVTVSFCVQNAGSANTTNLVGTLQNTGGVTCASTSQNYGVVAVGVSPVCRNFTFNVSGTCGGTITATIHFQDGSTDLGNVPFTFTFGASQTTTALAESFDGVTAPALPAGWTTAATGAESAWVTSATTPNSAPNAAFAPDPGAIGNTELVTPVIAIPAGGASQLSFKNNYLTEATYDGMVLEISINGGAFADIITAGGSFVAGGYNATIPAPWGNPIAGRQAWSGNSGGYITSTVNLPAGASGQNIQLKWRVGTDSIGASTGVRIDNITISRSAFSCCETAGTPCLPSFAIDDVAHNEGNAGTTSYTFTVTKTGSTAFNSAVNFTTVDGSATTANNDYQAQSGSLTFLSTETTKTITVLVNGDTTFEPDETFTVHLSGATNATISDADGTGTITNDDSVPTFATDDVTHNEGNAGTTSYTFTVTKTGSTAFNSSVNFTTVDGSATTANNDYQSNSGTLTFLPTDTTKQITVLVNGDTTLESDETFTVHLSGATGATISDADGTGTITNDDSAPAFGIDDVTHVEGNAGTTSYTFTVTKTGSTALNSAVDFATTDGTATTADNDYQAQSGTLTFLPTDTTKQITVVVSGDTTFEANEAFTVHLSGASSATIADADGAGTITNDDSAPTFAIDDVTHNEGNAGTTSYTFTVTKTGSTALNSAVNFTTVDGTATTVNNDYQSNSATLTFLPTETTKTITVLVNGDTTFEPDETFTVHLSGASSATISDADGTGTITNDDSAPTFAIDDVTHNEGNAGTTSYTFTVTKTGSTALSSAVNFTTVDGTATIASNDYQLNTGTLTFLATDTTKTITVLVNGDTTVEPDETFTVHLSGPSSATISDADGAGTITNDDVAPPPTLGNYPDTTVQAGANTTVTPDAAPTNTTSMNVSTSSAFKGTFAASPTTGVVYVTNAQPAGTYTVTVTAFNSAGVTTTKTFTLTVTNPTHCDLLSFSGASGSPVSVGTGPLSVAAGDFNRDGKLDLATANEGSNNVTIVLGDGLGGFSSAPGSPLAVGALPQSVAVGDFNGDGKQDLAIAIYNTSNVAVLLGDGLGGFGSAIGSPFAVGFHPRSVAVGDFNADGKLDLVTANASANTVTVLLGTGSGGFSPAVDSPFAVGSAPLSVALGDFNGDGKLDLVTANANPNNVTVLLGNGLGGFSPASGSPFAVGLDPYSVAMADVNGDGKLDLATANSSSNSVTVLLGDGSGSVSEASGSPFAAGSSPYSVAVGDFNGDGKPDLTTANSSSNDVTVLLGNGLGGFSAASGSPFAAGSYPYSVAVGDFNGDAKLDLTTANFQSNNVTVLLNTCTQNTAPTISAVAVTSQQGSPAANAIIANVGDLEDLETALTVTVNGGASATVNGVTVSGLAVSAPGVVTADVVASCTATTAIFTLRVTDTGGLFNEATLTVTVDPNSAPALTYASPQSVVFSGSLNLSPTTASDNGTITGYAVQAGHGLTTAPTVDASGVVSITNAQPAGSHTVTIRATDNCGAFTDAMFTLNVGAAPTFAIDDVTHNEGNAGTTSYIFTVTKTGSTALNSAVNFTTVDGTATTANNDYQANAGTLTFLPADATKTITVLVNGDTALEPDEAFTVHLSGASGATISDADGTGTITNDDSAPTFAIDDVTHVEGNAGTTSYTFTVTKTGSTALNSAVNFTTVDGTATTAGNDYQANAGTLTFLPTDTTKTITVLVNGDTTFEPDEAFTVHLSGASGATIADADGAGTITNDDTLPSFAIDDVTHDEGNAGTTSYTFTVTKTGSTALNSSVNFTTVDGSATTADNDYQAQSSTLTFLATDTIKQITVLVNGDTTVELDEAFTAHLSGESGATISDADGTGTITNDDVAPPTLGNYPDTTVQAGANTTVTPDAAPTNTTSMNVSTSSAFRGTFAASPTTGVVMVTNAHPAGTYTVTVIAFNSAGVTTTRTFTLTVTNPTHCDFLSFSGAVGSPFAVGTQPYSVAVGDFNDDGKQDLAITLSSSSNVTVLLGNGSGGFREATGSPFAVGSTPLSVAEGDFNGDGKQDLTTANRESNDVTVLLGNGSGGFSPASGSPFAVGTQPYSVAVGDFNGDGKLDLTTANYYSRNLTVLLGNGSGGFSPSAASPFALGTGPLSVAVGDFNADGRQDLATANIDSNNVTVLLGNGSGGFSPASASPFAVGMGPLSVAVGDFNADGKQDLTTANEQANNVTALLGDGLGGFSPASGSPFAVGTSPDSVAVGDFNGDGKLDLTTANFYSRNVTVLLGNGGGGFTAASGSPFAVGTEPASVAVGDFNGDGKLDLSTANWASNDLTVLVNTCTLNTAPTISAVGVTRQQGSPSANATIANVNDLEDLETALTMTVDGGTSATVNGVTVSTISVSTAGVVTADVIASCTATTATFTLRVTDTGGLFNEATLTATVNPNTAPTLTYESPQSVVFSGSLNVSPATIGDNGAVSYSVQSGHGLTTAPSVDSSGVVSITNAQPTGAHTVTIRATDNCGAFTDAAFTLNVGAMPTFAIDDVTHNEGNAGTTSYTFTVTKTGSTALSSSVNFTTVDGTATTADNDYQSNAGTLNFLPTDTTKSITVLVNGDTTFEPDEAFTVHLSGASGATISDADGAGTITNDDSLPSFAIDDVTHNEGNAGTTAYTFTVTKTGSTTLNSAVNFTTVDGSATTANNDYLLNTGALNFLATDTTKQITVVVNGDTTFEANEAFTVHLSGASGAIIADADGTGTLTNDDSAPTFAIDDVTHNEGDAGTTSYTFTVAKTGSTAINSSVNFTTVDGSATIANNDYQAQSGTLTFLPTDATKTITVLVNGDTTLEPDEAFTVHLSGASGATISDADGTGTIINDDTAPTFAIDDVTQVETNSDTTSFVFTVTKIGSTALNAVVNFNTVNGTATTADNDYQAQSGTLTFLAADTSKTITVLVNGDTTFEPDEDFTVHLSGASSATISDADGTGTITNDDVAPPTMGNYPDTTVQAGANKTVTPDAAPTSTASMNVSTVSAFRGTLTASPTTGIVYVTNAQPAGTYLVTVTAFNSAGVTTTKTFTLTVTNPTHCDFLSFSEASGSPFAAGSQPWSNVIGDFNGDGNQDLAIVNDTSNNVTVLLGNGLGGFSPAPGSPFAIGPYPYSIAVGDFNGDGKLDLTTPSSTFNNVTVLLGDGLGGFSPAPGSPFAVGSSPISIAVGDFNGDSKLDLTTANYLSNNVTVLLGNGSGGFSPASGSPFAVGSNPHCVMVGDFNGDGKQDLTTANNWSNNVTVLLGDGSGGFSPASASPFAVGTNPYSVAVGDFNGDGKLDLVIANLVSNNVTELLGDGSGGFTAAIGSPFAVGSSPYSVAVGDFNGDGRLDLTTANANGNVTVLLGNGSGFSPASGSPFAVGSSPYSVAVGDFNGDGRQDLTTANDGSNNTTVLLNTCTQNTAPTISAVGVTRQQGSPSTNATIANVNDLEDLETALIMTVNGGTSATVNGVTVSGISVSTAGVVTADVVASCTATTATFTLRVTDTGGLFNEATLTVTVNPNTAPTLTYASPQAVVFGGLLNLPPTATGDNGAVTYSVQAGHGLTTAPTVDSSGVVSITNAQPSGAHTITIRATDNCGAFTDAAFTLNVGAMPTFAIDDVAQVETNSGTTSFVFTVTKVGSTALNSSVNFTTVDGTATTADNDYQAQSGTLTFLPTDATKTITVLVNGDTTFEPDEAFTVHLSSPSGATISDADGIGTITNDDVAPPTLGNYPNTTVQAGANTTVTPDAAPTNTTGMNVSTTSAFRGMLAASPATGVVYITNAQPAGIYTVTVTAFNSIGATTTKTFTLTVNNPTHCDFQSFSGASGSPFSVNSWPYSVAVGDFNGDGKQDLATANDGSNNVTVLLGNGSGGFAAASGSPFAVANGPRSVAVADFNGDGKLDLTTAGSGSGKVTVLLGNGNGGFTPATGSPFAVGSYPDSVAVGDFNGDGKLDLATANSNNVTVLLGDGSGGFSEASGSPLAVGLHPLFVAVGDFNGDDKQDLATANGDSGNVTVLLGDGSGGFSPASGSPFAVGPHPQSVAVGDFNGDGKLDLVTANYISNNDVTVLLGNGSGGFSAASGSPFAVGSNPHSVAVADFNGDGKLDLATANYGSSNVTVLLGDGSGGFSAASGSPFAVSTDPTFLAVGDFNADGKIDLTIAHFNSNKVTVLLNTCTLNTAPTISAVGVTRQQGSPSANSTIANVNDLEDPETALSVTVNGGASATVNGVTVSAISVDSAGVVTGNVIATCTATTATFTLRVTDTGALFNEATLTVTVNPNSAPTLTYASPQSVLFSGSLNVTPTAASDNGTITGYAVQAGHGLTTAPAVDASGVVSITNAEPAGAHTVTIRATDNCGVFTDAAFTLNVGAMPTFAIDDVAQVETNSGTTSFVFTVTKVGSTALNSSVNFTTVDGTATTANNDYLLNTGVLNFLATDTTKTITILVNGDTTLEPDEAFTVHLSGASDATIGDPDGIGAITNDDGAPAFTIDNVTHLEGNSGTTSYTFTVTKTGSTALSSAVSFTTMDGTATTANNDYLLNSGTLTFLPAEITKPITVLVNGDATLEPDEAFTVHLSGASGATISDADGTGALINDDCDVLISNDSEHFTAAGGARSVTLTTSSACAWTAVSNDGFITITSGASGAGNGTVNYSVAANIGPARTGTMTIASHTFTVTQDSGCVYQLGSMNQNFVAAGGTNSVNVIAVTGCLWTAVSNDAWITVDTGTPGSGNGTVGYSVAANVGPARTGTMTIAGLVFTVTQDSGCTFTLSRDHQSFAGNGGNGAVNVTASDPACAWTASTTSTFVHITSGSSGIGNGAVQYSVDANAGSTIRSDTITVGGHTYTVYQGINFLDVPPTAVFYNEIGKLSARGVTLGCGNGNYCPNDQVLRDQMAAFIMRAKGEFNPPMPLTQRFADVPPENVFYRFIDRLAELQITLGCSPTMYCPSDPVKREQMAAFIIRGLGEFNPPTPESQRFDDVPPGNPFYKFIDRMAVLQITLGCSPAMYCPSDIVTRAQMAAFLVRAFDL